MSFYLLAITIIVYCLFIQLFRLGIAVNAIFFSLLFIDQATSLPGKCTIKLKVYCSSPPNLVNAYWL